MAGFCDSVFGLQAPKFGKCEANSPKVSGRYRELFSFSGDCGGRLGSIETAA